MREAWIGRKEEGRVHVCVEKSEMGIQTIGVCVSLRKRAATYHGVRTMVLRLRSLSQGTVPQVVNGAPYVSQASVCGGSS